MKTENYTTEKNGGRNGTYELLDNADDLQALINLDVDYAIQKINRALTIDAQGRIRDGENWTNGDTITLEMLMTKTRAPRKSFAETLAEMLKNGATMEDLQKLAKIENAETKNA